MLQHRCSNRLIRPPSEPPNECREGKGVVLHHCPMNFRDGDATELGPELLLDEERLTLLLDAVAVLFEQQCGWTGGRVAVDELLRAGLRP